MFYYPSSQKLLAEIGEREFNKVSKALRKHLINKSVLVYVGAQHGGSVDFVRIEHLYKPDENLDCRVIYNANTKRWQLSSTYLISEEPITYRVDVYGYYKTLGGAIQSLLLHGNHVNGRKAISTYTC